MRAARRLRPRGPTDRGLLTDYDALRALLDPEVLDGRVLINLSSGTSAQARETAAWVAQHGGTYLDGGIMAVPQGVGTAEATVVYSGPREVFDQYEPVLRSLSADNRYLGEDHGLSSLYEVAVLGLMWSLLNGFLQGAALLGAAGVSASAFTPVATVGIQTIKGWLAGYAEQIDNGAYPVLDATINTHLAAMEHVIDESSALGINAELPRSFKAWADRAAAAGHGDSGYPAMVELFHKPADS